MTFESIYRIWRDHFTGVVDEVGIVPVGSGYFLGKLYYHYACPCGDDDHVAIRPAHLSDEQGNPTTEPGAVLTCFVTDRQWLIRPTNVMAVIEDEERKYLKIIDTAPVVVAKVVKKLGWSQKTLDFLHDTHGIDKELAEDTYRQLNPV